MAIELPQDVIERLQSDHYGWLTTVARSGQPVPRLVWFYFDGADVLVYTEPGAAKVRHVGRHPRASLNLDSDGHGSGIIVVGGVTTVDAEGADPREDAPYWAKYAGDAQQIGLADSMGQFDLRLRISIDKAWTTPTPG